MPKKVPLGVTELHLEEVSYKLTYKLTYKLQLRFDKRLIVTKASIFTFHFSLFTIGVEGVYDMYHRIYLVYIYLDITSRSSASLFRSCPLHVIYSLFHHNFTTSQLQPSLDSLMYCLDLDRFIITANEHLLRLIS